MLWIKTDASAALRVKTKMQKTAKICLLSQILHLFSLKKIFFCKNFHEHHKYSIQRQFKSPILQNFQNKNCVIATKQAISKKGSKIFMKNVKRARISKCTAVS
jgi:hypothetical protein